MSETYVALLGTKGGPAVRPGSTMPTSSLLMLEGRPIVIDCGMGVTRGLVDQDMQLKDLRTIFITHLHSDHYLELGLLIHTAWTAGLKAPVIVWGPAGLEAYWDAFLVSMQADIDLRVADEGRPDLRTLVTIQTVQEGSFLNEENLSVSALRVVHPPLVDCFAFRFEGCGKRVVFSGDTAYCAPLIDFAQDADLLVHEAMLEAALPALLERIGNGSDRLMEHWLRSHCFAADAAQIAQKAGVKRLALNHLVPSDDPAFGFDAWQAATQNFTNGKLIIGTDGVRICLADTQ